MGSIRLIVASGFPALASLANAAETHSTVPVEFRGDWADSGAECRRGALSESRLTISENEITFYASRGQIVAIATHDHSLALIYEAAGEGYTWMDVRQFELSTDQRTLTEVTGGRRGTVRIRC